MWWWSWSSPPPPPSHGRIWMAKIFINSLAWWQQSNGKRLRWWPSPNTFQHATTSTFYTEIIPHSECGIHEANGYAVCECVCLCVWESAVHVALVDGQCTIDGCSIFANIKMIIAHISLPNWVGIGDVVARHSIHTRKYNWRAVCPCGLAIAVSRNITTSS